MLLPDPLVDTAAYASAALDLVNARQATILLPVTEASTLAVLERQALFGETSIPTSDLAHFRWASDKAAVLALAARMGIAVPRQWSITEETASLDGLLSQEFPLIVKPSRSITGPEGNRQKGNVAFANSHQDLQEIVAAAGAHHEPLLIQQRIEGPGLGVFLLRWEGRIIASFAHRRIREKPPSGGVSVCCESVALPGELLSASTSLLEALDWNGVAMIEFKHDTRSGRNYLMEINPRFWGSLQLAIDAGVDFPWYLLQAACGQPPAVVHEWKPGIRSRWVLGELDHLIARLRYSRAELSLPGDAPGVLRTAASVLTPWRPRQHNDVMRISDPLPSIREAASWLRAL